MGKLWKQWLTSFYGAPKSLQIVICSHEIKRRLLLGRKVMTNLDSIFKSRDITLPTKVRLVKVMVFPVVMYGCESWTVKKAEHRGIDAFELWCWRRLLRVPWTARRSNRSILKEISLGCSLEGLMRSWSWNSNTLATSCEELTHLKRPWCWERLGAGGEGDGRGWDGWMPSPTWWTWVWVGDGQGGLACCNSWGHKESDTTERPNWTEWLSSEESSCYAGATGDTGTIPGSGRSPGGEHGNLLQHSCLENPMDRRAWRARVHRVAKSDVTEAAQQAQILVTGVQFST